MKSENETRDERRFELPLEFEFGHGRRLSAGVMRRASPAAEMDALRDFRVWADPASFVPVLLSKVVRFDGHGDASPALLARLPEVDLLHLERLFRDLNDYPMTQRETSA